MTANEWADGMGIGGDADPVAAKDRRAAVLKHYAQICRCEWTDDELPVRTMASEKCSMHGTAPDPLAALLDVEEAARQLVRRDISIEVVALCEANLICALAEMEALCAV